MQTGFWRWNLSQRGHFEDLSVDGMIILPCIFKKYDEGRGLDWSVSGWRQKVDCCEHGAKPSGPIKYGNFLTSWWNISFSRRTILDCIYLFICLVSWLVSYIFINSGCFSNSVNWWIFILGTSRGVCEIRTPIPVCCVIFINSMFQKVQTTFWPACQKLWV
jgi:hypothetical protein